MDWSSHDLDGILSSLRRRRGDSTHIEVKRASGGVPVMPETLCAFANMPDGGSIILGVDEGAGDFAVTGLADVAMVEAGIAAQARQSVTPSPYIRCQTFTVDGKSVLVVHVAPLRLVDRPAEVRGRAYLRQSDGDYVMHAHELRMLEISQLHADDRIDYDLRPARGLSESDLAPDMVEKYLASVRERNRRLRDRSDLEILRLTSVLTAEGEPTLAGLYAMGTYPQGYYPALTVTAAVRLSGGEGRARNRNLEDFTGPVPVLLEELLVWVRANLSTEHVYRADGQMERRSELPLNAVRELLANALVHRDLGPETLGAGKSIQVRLDERKLLVQSPGGLRGVSLTQLESADHAQAAVNQRLYQICKNLTTSNDASVIEGEGGGIQEVFRSAQNRGLERPQLVDSGVQFTALMWRQRPEGSTVDSAPGAQTESSDPLTGTRIPIGGSSVPTKHEARVLTALVEFQGASIQDLADATGLTARQVRWALRKPLEEGIVDMVGGQGIKGTGYTLASAQ